MFSRLMTAFAASVALFAQVSTASAMGEKDPLPEFWAEIRYTAYGIPHIKADDYDGAGYGLGYAFAKDNVCLMSEKFVTLRGERSKHFGPDEGTFQIFKVFHDGLTNNLHSDFHHKHFYTDDVVQNIKDASSDAVQGLVTGFTAGYNRYLREVGPNGLPEACRNAAWVTEITEADVYRRAYDITILESANLLLTPLVMAAPPTAETESGRVDEADFDKFADAFAALRTTGSNAVGFGRDATDNGSGLLFGNPHFPWFTVERQYAAQLTVGDEYDVFGSTLYGVPIPLLGFNKDLAWSITYSTDQRFALYELTLDPSDPTKYIYDGETYDMVPVTVEVDVSQDPSQPDVRQHTYYETRHGPIFVGGPFQWTNEVAYALTDADRENYRMMDQYLDMGATDNVRDFKESQDRIQGLQFSNAVAADRAGDVVYTNISIAVDLPNEKLETCLVSPTAKAMFARMSLLVPDGSNPYCDLQTAPDAVQAGVIPPSRRPFLFRTDYVFNSNDSHWVVNGDPETFLEGFDVSIGDEQTPRGDRTRTAIAFIEDRLAGRDGRPGNKMSLQTMLDLFYASRSNSAEMMIDDLRGACADNPTITLQDGESIDMGEACEALDAFDLKFTPDSVGAHLFREILARLPLKFSTDYKLQDDAWVVPFDPMDPVNTPRGLVRNEALLQAMAGAVQYLNENDIPLNVPMGDVQFFEIDGEKIPASGNRYNFHLISPTLQKGQGYTFPVTYGDSFTHAVTFDEDGPVTKFVLAYSQSTDPDSPHFQDQLPLYLKQDWIDLPFLEADILADPSLRIVTISE